MALHPLIYPETDDYNRYKVPNGTCAVFPFSIGDEEIKKIILMHTDIEQQDFSLRVWIAKEPGGEEIMFYPLGIAWWHMNRNPHHIVAVYDEGYIPPEDMNFVLPVPQGNYFLHILNLTNRINSFSYFLDDAG